MSAIERATEILENVYDTDNGGINANVQDQITDEINLYLHVDNVTTNPTSNITIDTYTATLDIVVGASVGDVITILEGDRLYQSIIADITDSVVTVASSFDYAFTTAADVYMGDWNLNLNGSITPIVAHIGTAPLAKYDIYQVNITMTDGSVMDSSKFGGLDALTNGVVLRHKNGILKNLLLAVNNIGFSEQGFTLQYDDKAPAGVYGIQIKKNYKKVSGIAIRTIGSEEDELQFIIRDDLTDLSLLTVTVQGHKVQE